jgi:hypothetical protein
LSDINDWDIIQLEANVKHLQSIVDKLPVVPEQHLYPPRNSSSSFNTQLVSSSGSAPSIALTHPTQESPQSEIPRPIAEDEIIRRLQVDNGRLRHERDALRVRLDAVVEYMSRGYAPQVGPGPGLGEDLK